MNLIGIHCSISGSINNAVAEALDLGINTMQIFTKNQRQWNEKEYTDKEADDFKDLVSQSGIQKPFSHTTYLLNLASQSDESREKSINGLIAEVERCEKLGLYYTVLHPGSHPDEKTGIELIADGLIRAVEATGTLKTKILLENTAGQGNTIGRSFDQLLSIIEKTGTERIGICFDTCHAFAAGFDIRETKGLDDVFNEIDSKIGLRHLHAIHLNDSKGELGSHLDRHENIGFGKLGTRAFAYILERFPEIPKTLETDKEDDWDKKNLEVLYTLLK